MNSYAQVSQFPVSEKLVLVTAEAVELVKLFSVYSGDIYERNVDNFVISVKINSINKSQALSLASISSSQPWFYDIKSKKLYIYSIVDPLTLNISLTYKFFFSNAPVILAYDLEGGEQVEWNPIISKVGSVGQQLDDENTGIVLDSQSSVEFINNHGFFDDKFDSLIWENQLVVFYQFFGSLNPSEAKQVFHGVIESKEFSPDKVLFKVKDLIFKLRDRVNLGEYTSTDGTVPDSFIGKPKRRIYGKVNKLACVPVDATLNGYSLTGSIQFLAGSNSITGTGTQFLKELSPNDEVSVTINDEEFKFTINQVISNNQANVARNFEISSTGSSAVVIPSRPYRFKNRRWHIAGHRIRATRVNVVDVINARVFVVDDVSELFESDFVTINGLTTQIARISGQKIFLEQNLSPQPLPGDYFTRSAVTNAYFGISRFVLGRDYSYVTDNNDSVLVFHELAEFNIARERLSSVQLTFTNGSSEVTTGSTIDLRTIIQPRDWIRRSGGNASNWFEVLEVLEQKIILRENYDQVTSTSFGLIKNVELINDDSLILVDCYGKDSGNETTVNTWIRNASQAVYDLVTIDAGFDKINLESFEQAASDNGYLLSLPIPESLAGSSPLVRDAISSINESVFGSLYVNDLQEICFSALNTRKPAEIDPIGDDDVISWAVNTSQSIVNKVRVLYAPFVDSTTGQDSINVEEFNSEFVDNNIGIKNTLEKTAYIYNKEDAQVLAQRFAFYNSLSKSILRLNGKTDLLRLSVNDKLYVGFDRLYKRFAGKSRQKIGIVSGIKSDFYDVEVTINDLGNIFNRCLSIAPDETSNFAAAKESDKIKFGFILDNNTLTPNQSSEDGLGGNLIG